MSDVGEQMSGDRYLCFDGTASIARPVQHPTSVARAAPTLRDDQRLAGCQNPLHVVQEPEDRRRTTDDRCHPRRFRPCSKLTNQSTSARTRRPTYVGRYPRFVNRRNRLSSVVSPLHSGMEPIGVEPTTS